MSSDSTSHIKSPIQWVKWLEHEGDHSFSI